MAELVGTVASVAQLISLSGELLAGGYGFLAKVARAPSEIRSLLTEAAAINSLLAQLQCLTDAKSELPTGDALSTLERLGVFRECQTTLKSIQKALTACEQMHGNDVKNFGRRLIWPFKERETKEALQRLHHLRDLLANAVEANNAVALRRVEMNQGLLLDEMTSLTDIAKAKLSREEAKTVFSWICPLPSDGAQASLENALSLRVQGTGEWFLKSDIFQEWLKPQHESPAIWITGLPGSGKTLLCASIIDTVRQLSSNSKRAVLFFFCDHRDRSKITLENFLMNITKQMLNTSPACLEKARVLYEEKGKNFGRPFNRSEYLPLIKSFVEKFEEIFLIVDALDEAADGNQIASVLNHLRDIAGSQSIIIKTLFTSRFDVRIEQRYPLITTVRITLADNVRQDIEHYIKWELERRVSSGAIKLRDKKLRFLIQKQIEGRAGTLLQARLQLDYLATAKTDRNIKALVHSLPNGLDYTYETLLSTMASRFPGRISEMKMLLHCIVAAASPLTATQLSEIMAMKPGERFLDFDSVTTDPYDTLEVIAPFVVVDREEKDHGIIKLSHYSLEEYLHSEKILQGPARYFHVYHPEADAWLAAICLQYLTFSVFDLPADTSPVETDPGKQEKYTFYNYAALNWYKHMQSTTGLPGFKDLYEPYLLWFVNGGHGPPCYEKWQETFHKAFPFTEAGFHSPICFAIWAELDELVDYLLPMLDDVDRHFADGFTCLTVAAMCNGTAAARKLLALGADVNKATSDRQLTPLHLAAEFSSEDTFALLLDAGADPHARSGSGTTAFYRAARGGNTHILRRLRECDCDVNACTFDNWTPLLEAVENGHEEVVDLLLEWGADPNIKSNGPWETVTPVTLADALPYRSIARKIRKAAFGWSPSESELDIPAGLIGRHDGEFQ